MPTQEDIDDQQALLAVHRRTLAHYLRQRARLGKAFEPPGVGVGIDDARADIARIKATLRSWGINVEDHPDDEERPTNVQVTLLLEGDIESFTPERRAELLSLLAQKINVSFDQIRLMRIEPGSIKLTLDMPEDAAQRLVALYAAADPSLEPLGLLNVIVQPRKPLGPQKVIVQPRKPIIGKYVSAVAIAFLSVLLIVGAREIWLRGGFVAPTPVVIAPTAPLSTKIAGSPTPAQPTPPSPTSCVYSGATTEVQLEWLIEAEARAANNKNLELITAIFAPDAIIINGANDKDRSNTPIAHYGPFFGGATITDAKHTAIRNLGINENVAYFTSASSGKFNGTPYANPSGSEHWTFRKNPDGCWVIAEFDFNARHLPFPPPASMLPTATPAPAASETACAYLGATTEAQLGWLIEAEARAANTEDRDLIAAIFAPDALIIDGASGQRWKTPGEHYVPLFDGATIEGATHIDIHNLGIQEAVAYFTSASSGKFNGTSYTNPSGSEHWTFRKNPAGCWVIAELDFNASHLPFPPTP